MLRFDAAHGVFNCRVVGVLIEDDAVLAQRGPGNDFWALPGGRCEFGEASFHTLEREFLEELGVSITVGRLLWVVENFFRNLGPQYHEIAFYYLVTPATPLPRNGEFFGRIEDRDPPLTFRWVPLADIGRMRLYPTFLRQGLRQLPQEIVHLVHRDDGGRT